MVKVNKILVSQPRPSSDKSPYFDIEKKYGVEIVFRPFIKVEGLTSKEFRQQKISLPEHTAVIFTANLQSTISSASQKKPVSTCLRQ